jgi:peptidoglycan/xylan/chitin deacetylase (PgdA/CDA1 family)
VNAVACFSFDNMGEAAQLGAGSGDGTAYASARACLERGYPALFALLERQGIRASFFVEGWNGVHHPDAVAEIVRRGHELGMHGWLHEPWRELEPAREEALALRATLALERASGTRPLGFRAPGGARTPATERILRELGYAYDASLGDGMQPRLLDSGLAQVPFVWPGVDGFHYLRPEPVEPSVVRDAWLTRLARTAEGGGLFLLIGHAFITGTDAARLDALEAVIEAARRDPRVSIQTLGELARAMRARGKGLPALPRAPARQHKKENP